MLTIDLKHLEDVTISPFMLEDGGALDLDICPDCWERTAHIERYVFACKAFKGMNLLDFGCGVGFGSEMLVDVGNKVTGLDTSSEAIKLALKRRGFKNNLKFTQTLPTQWFDGCTAFEVIEHIDDPEEFINTVKARHLLASVPVIPTVGINPHHKTDFTVDSFRTLLEKRFTIHSWWVQIMPFHNSPSVAVFHGEVRK